MVTNLGDRNEERVCWHYKREGYEVWLPIKPRWGRTKRFGTRDILGIFDVIATRDDELVLAQVKSENAYRKAVEKEILAIPVPDSVAKEYWLVLGSTAKVRRYLGGRVSNYVCTLV